VAGADGRAFGGAGRGMAVLFGSRPVIEISFQSAAGMSPGETVLRYRDVNVGLVEDVAFSDNLDRLLATVRLDKDIASFVDADAQFWIIRPEVTALGVTGLDTVLSGVYIEGAWDGEPDGLVVRHEALGDPPLAAGGQVGLRIVLNASPGAALSEGAPILYKGIEVGRIGKPGLSDDGVNAQANAIVFEPYDKIITTATRFWDTSGFTFSIGTGGAELDFTSIASLIGGVAFETIVSGGRPAMDGAVFGPFADEGRARASLFDTSEGTKLNLTVVFRENFSGLAVGAPVELEGVRIGEVSSIRGIVDEDRFGDDAVRLLATLALLPSRLSLDVTEFDDPLDYFEQRVDAGLRARLVTATILTGGLKVEMIEVPDAPIELMDLSAEPYPILPSTQSELSDMTATAEGVFQRINALPIEEFLVSAIGFLDAAETLVGGEDARKVPGDVRGLVASQELQTLPAEVSALVGELQLAAADIRIVTASLSEADLVARLQGAVDAAAAAATGIETSVAGVPELLTSLTALSDRAASLPLETMITQVSETLASAETLFASEGIQALPGALATTMAEVEAALLELREGGAVRNLNQTLASAETAAAAIETAVAGLPSLAVRIEALVAQAENTLSGVDQDSELSREARASLRDIRNAAKAFESLSRALERRPNSVILGR